MEFNNDKAFMEYTKTRDIELRNKIALNNYNLIYPAIRGLYSPNVHDVEEIEQEAFISLLKAVETFDITRGVKFSTYAYKCIKSLTRRRVSYGVDVSANKVIGESDGDKIELLDTIEDDKIDVVDDAFKKDLHSKIKDIMDKRLSKKEAYVLTGYFLQERKCIDIAKDLNVPPSRVTSLKHKALRKLGWDPFFIEYKKDFISQNEISYVRAYNYDRIKVKTNEIHSPVWSAVLQMEQRDNKLYKEFLSK